MISLNNVFKILFEIPNFNSYCNRTEMKFRIAKNFNFFRFLEVMKSFCEIQMTRWTKAIRIHHRFAFCPLMSKSIIKSGIRLVNQVGPLILSTSDSLAEKFFI